MIPDKKNKIKENKFRKEINENKEDLIIPIEDLDLNYDLDEIPNLDSNKLKEIIQQITQKAEENGGISLFIARKFIKFEKEFSQEIKYKKFLLVNIILGLSVLCEGGTFVIKIYDTFTYFTISLIYILFNMFESLTIMKPFSTRPHSGSRYIVCQKLKENKEEILNFLFDFYERYIDLLKEGQVKIYM